MATITIGPLRWLEEPSRITIRKNGESYRSYYQVTAPRDLSEMCRGRPAEELPRILSILSPSHHIASAIALDNLFAVPPPSTARNIREALLQSLTFIHHSRKLFFLLSSFGNPIGQREEIMGRTAPSPVPHHVLDEIMQGTALAQEAASILGGRHAHPVTAVAGGVSRLIKEVHYRRLSEIAEFCLPYALRLRDIFREKIVRGGNGLYKLMSLPVCPITSVTFCGMEDSVVLTGESGIDSARFSPNKTPDMLETICEPWTYLPFVHMKGTIWEGPISAQTSGLLFVGSLARLNRCKPASTPQAEEERQQLVSFLGPLPHFSAIAGYWSLVVELIQTAETMKDLFMEEKLTGLEVRTIASNPVRYAHGALEAPEGFIYHEYETDERGIVEHVTVLDAAAENNALRSLLIQNMVDDAVVGGKPWAKAKKNIELSLVPF